MSEQFWTLLINAVVTVVTTLCGVWVLWIKQGSSAAEVKQAARSTDAKLDGLTNTASATHTLVNNNMAVQLKLNAELSRWKANQTKLPADVEAADAAERLYRAHMERQAKVDEHSAGPP